MTLNNWTLTSGAVANNSQLVIPTGRFVANTAVRSTDEGDSDRSFLSTSPSLITASGTPTAEQFEDIRTRFGDPRAEHIKPTDYYVFRLIASGDGLDSYFTRHDLETSYPNMVRDLHKGQSLLGSHLMATFSYGSSYNGAVEPADEQRAEYEPTFYPQWDSPDLRTKNWLVGDYFMTRGMTVNNQKTDDLILGIETGAIRKVSISFMVGSYVCGVDGKDLVPTMFGLMPDDECSHFPGIAYDDGHGGRSVAWALMKNNTLVETSLVYKNASPSSMLLRKAESLAERGQLEARDIERLESRFQIRLPRFQPHVWTMDTTSSGINAHAVRFDAQVQEDNDMANRRRGGDEAARELREILTAPEPEAAETEEVSEAPEGAELVSEAAADPEPDTTEDGTTDNAESEEVVAEAAEADESSTDEPEVAEAAAPGDEQAESEPEPVAAEVEGDAAEAVSEEDEADTTEVTSESSREEDVVSAFVTAADQLVSSLARNPDAYDTGLLAMAARAEKGVDLALSDAGCDATVGAQVYRSFEIRSKKLTEALGEPLTVEAIRSLQGKAQLGDELFRELVKDAVAARVTAQGETFSADRYREVLLGTRDVQYVKDEVASWKSAKKDSFAPGRQVIPRQPMDVKPTKDERKALPEAPAALSAGKPKADASSMSLIQPRKK